jgi:mannose-6-phosphate isomerase-like protein (cupin superfamily)
MIIKLKNVPDVLQPPRPMRMKRVINRLQHTEGISLTWVEIWGRHEKVVCDRSDRVYYIISGEGVFQVGDDPEATAAAGDVVFIPRGVPYVFEGQMTYVVMNGPAFVEGSDTVLD